MRSARLLSDSMTSQNKPISGVSEDAVEDLAILELRPAFERQTSSFSTAWSGLVSGTTPPRWWAPDLLIPGDALQLYSTDDAYYVPSLGAVLTAGGQIFLKTARHATYIDPKLEQLQKIWSTRASAPRLADGIVTMSWGALHNYGHFVLDAMTSVAAIAELAVGWKVPFVTPPLREWQRQHFNLLQIEPLELAEPIYSFGHIAFVSGMKGALHNPNLHFQTLRDAQLSSLPAATGGAQRIYISRRGQKRPLINEDKLELALESIGFAIIHTETMSIAQQIETFRNASIIVAPTGAALGNLLYAQKATVFEIIPRGMTLSDTAHKWVAFLTAMGEGDWRPFFCEDCPESKQAEIVGQRPPGYRAFELSIPELLSFIAPVLV